MASSGQTSGEQLKRQAWSSRLLTILFFVFLGTTTIHFFSSEGSGLATLMEHTLWIAFLSFFVGMCVHIVVFKRALFAFLLRRFSLMLITMLGITMVTFTIIQLAPGDPVSATQGAGDMGEGIDSESMSRDAGKTKRELLGLLEMYTFKARVEDPNGGKVRLEFSWGDGSANSKTEFVESGEIASTEHSFSWDGTYRIQCRAIDEKGAKSDWSDHATLVIKEENPPPSRPGKPQGKGTAFTGEEVTFTTKSIDPEGKKVSYIYRWGDGSGDSIRMDPGKEGSFKHKWTKSGRFQVQVRAQDEAGAISDWSEPAEIMIYKKGNPFVDPYEFEIPSTWEVAWGMTIRVRVPEIQPLEGDKAFDKTRILLKIYYPKPSVECTSEAVVPGEWVTFKHTFLPDTPETEKGIRVRIRTIQPDKDGGMKSSWVTRYVMVTKNNRPPLTPQMPEGRSEGPAKRPIWKQYLTWLGKIITLDFGNSSKTNGKILSLHVKEAWPPTIEAEGVLPKPMGVTVMLSLISIFIVYLFALPIGIYSSTHQNSKLDKVTTLILFIFYSLPNFWVATMLIVLVTPFKGIPFIGLSCTNPDIHPFLGHQFDFAWHLILPIFCLTFGGLAALSRYARSGMIEVVRQDYIRTARAKGLSEKVVIFKHALRNGMIPILTLLANLLPALIGGSIIIEVIFSIDGMGNLGYMSVVERDYNVVMAIATLSAVMTLVGMLLSDLAYVLVDPRISFESAGE